MPSICQQFAFFEITLNLFLLIYFINKISMKAHNQIVITVNSSHLDSQKDKSQIILWLHNTIPVILQERKAVTENIFLHLTNQPTNFCLS